MLNLSYKKDIHQACISHVNKSLSIYQKGIKDAQQGLQSESKSSAGDKHETGRAMLQLEAEKLGAQYQITLNTLNFIKQLDIIDTHHKIQLGSLIETTIGLFYICSGIGAIELNGIKIFVLSPVAPLSKVLMNKKVEDRIIFNNRSISIQSII